MGILLIILYVIAGIIALVLLAALFIKKSYTIQREIVINRPVQQVFDYVKYIRNQDHYNKWVLLDPASKKEYKGIDGTTGFVATWDSTNKQVGKGEQEITGIEDGKRIELALHFIKPFEGRAVAYMETAPATGNQTKITWGLSSSMKYPMNIMLVLMKLEEMLGNDLATSLNNLKQLLEK